MIKKFFVKIFSAFFKWEDVIKIFLTILFNLASSWQKDKTFNKKQKMLIRVLAALNIELGAKWASESPTDVDNDFVDKVTTLAFEMAVKHNFELYIIPPLN